MSQLSEDDVEIEMPYNEDECSQPISEEGHESSSEDVSSSSTSAPTTEGQASRQCNLQIIQQRKQQVYNWPQSKKLLELAMYSACQMQDCNCNGWKAMVTSSKGNTHSENEPLAGLYDSCMNCKHILEKHICHLQGCQASEINHLLGAVVDVENIFMSMHREDDHDVKRVYCYLLKLLRKCILMRTQPLIEGPLGQPPFERPSIAKAITNFVLYKFHSLPQREWQTKYILAKMFLYCFNHWNFETPIVKKLQLSNPEDISAYQINYTRWLMFCHVPVFCDSLPHYEASLVFGRTLLRAVFESVCRQFMDKCHMERDNMSPEKKELVLIHFPHFLSLFAKEIFTSNSPIWDPEYKPVVPNHLQVS